MQDNNTLKRRRELNGRKLARGNRSSIVVLSMTVRKIVQPHHFLFLLFHLLLYQSLGFYFHIARPKLLDGEHCFNLSLKTLDVSLTGRCSYQQQASRFERNVHFKMRLQTNSLIASARMLRREQIAERCSNAVYIMNVQRTVQYASSAFQNLRSVLSHKSF